MKYCFSQLKKPLAGACAPQWHKQPNCYNKTWQKPRQMKPLSYFLVCQKNLLHLLPAIKKGQTGPSHPAYKHGKGTNRDFDAAKNAAWIQAVKSKFHFRCFITGETDKAKLECHHLNAWNWCIEGRYDLNNGAFAHACMSCY